MAQNAYSVAHYTSENGLPQNSIKSIAADADGFIWLATEDGLVRFDGRHFNVFNESNLDITSSRIVEIIPSLRKKAKGIQQKGHERIHLTYATNPNGEAIRIEGGHAIRDTVNRNNKSAIFKSMKRSDLNVVNVSSFPAFWIDNSKDYPVHIIMDGNGDQNFYRCDSVQVQYYKNWKEEYTVKSAASNLWNYFSLGDRLYYFNNTKSFIQIFNNKRTEFAINGDILENPAYPIQKKEIKLFWNNNSDQAFLYLSKRLYLLEQQLDGKLITKLLSSNFDLISQKIDIVHFDSIAEKIYFGSVSNGLYVLTRQQFKALTIKEENYENVFYAQLPHKDGTILTPNGLVVGYNNLTNQTVKTELDLLKQVNPSDKRIFLRDKNNTIWVKNFQRLIHLDKGESGIKKSWIFNHEIKAICQGEDSTIWIGVIDQGLYRLHPGSNNLHPELFANDILKFITHLTVLNEGQLLAGTMKGLYKIDISTKEIALIKDTEGIFIKNVLVSSADEIWITGEGKGLMLMNKKGEVTTFPLDKNRYLTSAHCIVNDSIGYLWIPTNRGLFQIARQDLLKYAKLRFSLSKKTAADVKHNMLLSEIFYMYHAMDEGFNTNEFNGNCAPCGIMLPNGYVSLPSLIGLVWFRPKLIRRYAPDGPIILDKIESNQILIKASGDTIRLPLNPEDVRLFFSTAYFGNSYNLNASYALVTQGKAVASTDWRLIDNNDFSIQLPALLSGDFELHVRKLNGFGIGNYTERKIYINVPQMWYETNWAISSFAILFGLLLSSLIYFYSKYKLKKITEENARLEETITNRTETLNQTLLGLETSRQDMNEQLHLLSRLVTSISHDIQSPLRYLAFISKQIPEMLETKQLDDVSKLGTTISDMSDRMGTMLQDLLDFIKVQIYGKRIHFEPVELRKLVDDKLNIFEKTAEQNSSYFINEIPSNQTVVSDYQLLSIVIHNLIDNAAKYTKNGVIRIYVDASSNEHYAELLISNTGQGIPKETIELLNSSGTKKSLEELMNSGKVKGLGLLIVKEISDLIDINVKVTEGDVTTFHLLFEMAPSAD